MIYKDKNEKVMNIKFIIGYPVKTFATDWQEIRDLGANEYVPNRETFNLFKALEFNTQLDVELKRTRKKLRIPAQGLSWEQYKRRKVDMDNRSDEEIEDITYFIVNGYKEIVRIKRKLALHPQVEEQLENLILGDFVEPNYRGIAIGCNGINISDYENVDDLDEYAEVDQVMILMTKRTSRNELHKFIDDNWDETSRFLEMLPPEEHFYMSSRDLRIVQLRDIQKMKYKDIADIIVSEFAIDDLTGAINEDSVKTSYKRAQNKIDKLAKNKEK